MQSFLQNTRYYWRELLPRAVVMFVCTYFLMPHAPGLAYVGNVGAAIGAALFFTAYFWLWGSQIMGMESVQRFMSGIKNRMALLLFHTAVMLFIPVLAVVLDGIAAGETFIYSAWYGYLVWAIALNICCILTHDWGANKSP